MSSLSPIKAAMQTDRGLVRDHNEDYIIRHEPNNREEEETYGWLYIVADGVRSEERRVGKECRSRWSPYH